MTTQTNPDLKQAVRDRYARAAEGAGCCEPSCCGADTTSEPTSQTIDSLSSLNMPAGVDIRIKA